MLQVAEICGRCEMNESPVILRLLNFFCLGFFFFLEVPGRKILQLVSFIVHGFGFRNRHRFFDGHGFVPGRIFF